MLDFLSSLFDMDDAALMEQAEKMAAAGKQIPEGGIVANFDEGLQGILSGETSIQATPSPLPTGDAQLGNILLPQEQQPSQVPGGELFRLPIAPAAPPLGPVTPGFGQGAAATTPATPAPAPVDEARRRAADKALASVKTSRRPNAPGFNPTVTRGGSQIGGSAVAQAFADALKSTRPPAVTGLGQYL
jgi:hypothetical protein